MRKYIVKDENDLIKQIESDPELDKEWEEPVKGHVVEIRYSSKKNVTIKRRNLRQYHHRLSAYYLIISWKFNKSLNTLASFAEQRRIIAKVDQLILCLISTGSDDSFSCNLLGFCTSELYQHSIF